MTTYIIKTLKKTTYELSVIPDETVGELKERLLEEVHIKENPQALKEHLVLICGGKILENNFKMNDYLGKPLVLHVSEKMSKAVEKKTVKEEKKEDTTNTRSPSTTLRTPNTISSVLSSSYSMPAMATSTGQTMALGLMSHQNDFHVANMLSEVFQNEENVVTLLKNTNYYKTLSEEHRTNVIDDLQHNVITKNVQELLNFLLHEYNHHISHGDTHVNIHEDAHDDSQDPFDPSASQFNDPAYNQLIQMLAQAFNINPNMTPPPDQQQQDINTIKGIVGGSFSDQEIQQAYQMCRYNVEGTINLLLGGD